MRTTTTPFFDRGFLAGLSISASLHAGVVVALSYYVVPSPGGPPPVRKGEHAIRITLLPETQRFSAADLVAAEAGEPEPDVEPSSAAIEHARYGLSTPSETESETLGPPPAGPVVIEPTPRSLPPEPADPPEQETEPEVVVAKDSPPASPPGLPEGASPLVELSPHYPRRCRRLGHEGTVRLEVEVSVSGRATSVRVVSSAGCEDLDESAVAAVRTALFEPARRGGRPVKGAVILPITFRLK